MGKSVRFDLVANPSGYVRGFAVAEGANKRFSNSFGRVGAGIGSVARSIGRAALTIGVGMLAVGTAVAFGLLKTVKAAEAAKSSTADVANAIRSTGGAAKVSSGEVVRLAQSISNHTGASQTAIKTGAAMLLTFTSVRNETGRGNNIFTRATSIVTDMTAKLHQGVVTQEGMSKVSIQVGKALNDPIRGMTALRRVGVQFNEQQVQQITKMTKSGNLLGAQKLIMKELEKEFGGTAKAIIPVSEKLKTLGENAKIQIGTVLLPYIDKFADWMGRRLPGAVTFVAGKLTIFARNVASAANAIKVGWTGKGSAAGGFDAKLSAIAGKAHDAYIKIGGMKGVIQEATKASIALTLVKLGAAFGGWGIAAGLAAAGIFLIYSHNKSLQDSLRGIWSFVTTKLSPAWHEIANFFQKFVTPRLHGLKAAWDENKVAIQGFLSGPGGKALAFFGKLLVLDIGVAITELTAFVTFLGVVARAINKMVVIGEIVVNFFRGPFVAFMRAAFVRVKVDAINAALDMAIKFTGIMSHLPGVAGRTFRDIHDKLVGMKNSNSQELAAANADAGRKWTQWKDDAKRKLDDATQFGKAKHEDLRKRASQSVEGLRVAANAKFAAMKQQIDTHMSRAQVDTGKEIAGMQRHINSLKGKTVAVSAKPDLVFSGAVTAKDWAHFKLLAGRAEEGGAVRGSGQQGRDSLPYLLAPGEHIWTDKEVAAVQMCSPGASR